MNKQEAADYLDVSTRAIERYTAKGRLTPAYEKGRTGLAPVYDKAQLDELKKEMDTPSPRPVVGVVKPDKLDRRDKAGTGKALALRGLGLGKSEALAELIAAIEAARSAARPYAPLEAKLTLNLSEASALSGLSRHHLREAIDAGKLKARIIGRGWRVKRADLETYVRKL
jgi:excisionase family DNA binding protein